MGESPSSPAWGCAVLLTTPRLHWKEVPLEDFAEENRILIFVL